MSENKKMIFIPQGCFGKIDTNTPNDIVGMYTTGLGSCACLIVTNESRSISYLAHIDGYFNIADQLKEWIDEIQSNTMINDQIIVEVISPEQEEIEIHCGRTSERNTSYYSLIQGILEGSKYDTKIKNEMPFLHIGYMDTALIFRKGSENVQLTNNTLLCNSSLYKNKMDTVILPIDGQIKCKEDFNGINYTVNLQFLDKSGLQTYKNIRDNVVGDISKIILQMPTQNIKKSQKPKLICAFNGRIIDINYLKIVKQELEKTKNSLLKLPGVKKPDIEQVMNI